MEILYFKQPNFWASNLISTWIKFPFTGLISEYNIFKSCIYNFIKLKLFLMSNCCWEMLIGSWTCFFLIMDKFSSFVDPRLMMPIWRRGKKEHCGWQVNSAEYFYWSSIGYCASKNIYQTVGYFASNKGQRLYTLVYLMDIGYNSSICPFYLRVYINIS